MQTPAETIEEIEKSLLEMCGDSYGDAIASPISGDDEDDAEVMDNIERLCNNRDEPNSPMQENNSDVDEDAGYVSLLTLDDTEFKGLGSWLNRTYISTDNVADRNLYEFIITRERVLPNTDNERSQVNKQATFLPNNIPRFSTPKPNSNLRHLNLKSEPVPKRRVSFSELVGCQTLPPLPSPPRISPPPTSPPPPLPLPKDPVSLSKLISRQPLPPLPPPPPIPPFLRANNLFGDLSLPSTSYSRPTSFSEPVGRQTASSQPPRLPPLPSVDNLYRDLSLPSTSYSRPMEPPPIDNHNPTLQFCKQAPVVNKSQNSKSQQVPVQLERVKKEIDNEIIIDFEAKNETINEVKQEVKQEIGDDFIPLPDFLRDEEEDDDVTGVLKALQNHNSRDDEVVENMEVDVPETPETPENTTVDSSILGRRLRSSFANIFDKFNESLDQMRGGTREIEEDMISIFADDANEEWMQVPEEDEAVISKNETKDVREKVGKVKKERKAAAPFISNDENENRDNEDPEWEALKKLNTDDERYKVVRIRWKNLKIPDPNVNLTTQNYRMKRIGRPVQRKRKRSTDDNPQSRKKMKSCGAYYEGEINKLKSRLQEQKNSLQFDFDMRKQQLENELNRQRGRIQRDFAVKREMRNANFSRLQQTLVEENQKLVEEYDFTKDQLEGIFNENMKSIGKPLYAKIAHMKHVKDEVLSFNRYYSGLKNSALSNVDRTMLSEERMQEIIDIESVYALYNRFYITPQ